MINSGWICPICGGVFSPITPRCFNCTGRHSTGSSTSFNGEEIKWKESSSTFTDEFVKMLAAWTNEQ